MWKNFLTDYENSGFFKILDDNYKNDKFEEKNKIKSYRYIFYCQLQTIDILTKYFV